jgi:hypothetical protein
VLCECGKVYAGQAGNPSKPNVRNIWDTYTWASQRSPL